MLQACVPYAVVIGVGGGGGKEWTFNKLLIFFSQLNIQKALIFNICLSDRSRVYIRLTLAYDTSEDL